MCQVSRQISPLLVILRQPTLCLVQRVGRISEGGFDCINKILHQNIFISHDHREMIQTNSCEFEQTQV